MHTIDTVSFAQGVARFAHFAGKIPGEVLKTNVKGALRVNLTVTPPRQGDSAAMGEARGRSKMAKDLLGGKSTGARHSRRYGIFSVLPDSLIDSAVDAGLQTDDAVRLWTTKDGRVYGVQKSLYRPDASQAELRAHHKRYFQNGQMSRAGTYSRDIARWQWIDKMVIRQSTFEAYLKSEQKMIGFYTRGWSAALSELGVPAPAYAKRSPAAPGVIRVNLTGPHHFSITIENNAAYSERFLADVRRRLQWAVNVQAAKMERQIPYLIKAAARRAGANAT